METLLYNHHFPATILTSPSQQHTQTLNTSFEENQARRKKNEDFVNPSVDLKFKGVKQKVIQVKSSSKTRFHNTKRI